MSRIPDGDYSDEYDDLRSYAFTGNVERSLRGKRGKKFLAELEASLLALPEKVIVQGTFHDEAGDVCPLGAVFLKRQLDAGKSREEAIAEMDRLIGDPEDCFEWENISRPAAALKICEPLAYAIIDLADERIPRAVTPQERYERVLSWVRRKLQEGTKP